jgi:hypothetical protein
MRHLEIIKEFKMPLLTLTKFALAKKNTWENKLYEFLLNIDLKTYNNYLNNYEDYDLVILRPYNIINWEYRMQIIYLILNKPYYKEEAVHDMVINQFATNNFIKEEYIELFYERENSKLYKRLIQYIENAQNDK